METPAFAIGNELLEQAFAFAREKHEGQVRRGEPLPYITHPVAVAELVHRAGYSAEAVAAAFLHDVVEDAKPRVTPEEIDERFGAEIGRLVRAMTENKLESLGKDKADETIYALRKQLHREKVEVAGEEAHAIFVADKIANLRDATEGVRRHGAGLFDSFNAKDAPTYLAKSRVEADVLRRVSPELPLLPEFDALLEELGALLV